MQTGESMQRVKLW